MPLIRRHPKRIYRNKVCIFATTEPPVKDTKVLFRVSSDIISDDLIISSNLVVDFVDTLQGPNYMWHMDDYDKLSPYGFMKPWMH